MMIIIIASVIGVLTLAIVIMLIRVAQKKRRMQALTTSKIDEVATGVVEIEPQFVLAADDSKNIFARPSTSPLNEMIEGSDKKKPNTADSKKKRKTKKIVVRKKMPSATRDSKSSSGETFKLERQDGGEDSGDDGFRNYDGSPAPRVASPPESDAKSFSETNRSEHFGEFSTTRKLKLHPLEKIHSDEEE